MSTYEVWMEGYRATGEHAEARLLARVEANSFTEARDTLCTPADWQHRNGNYDRVHGTVWGCRLFDNEADARRAFG